MGKSLPIRLTTFAFALALTSLLLSCQKFSVQNVESAAPFRLSSFQNKISAGEELLTSKGCLDTNDHNPHTSLEADTIVSWYGDSKMYGGCYLFGKSLSVPSQISTSEEWGKTSVGSLESPLPKKVSDLSGGILTFKQRAVNATSLFQLEQGTDGVNLSWEKMMSADRSRIVVLAHGTNDVWQDIAAGRTVTEFKNRLQSMVWVAKSKTKAVILMEPYKVCSFNALIPSGAGHTNEQAEALVKPYVLAIREIAKVNNLALIPAFDLPLSCPSVAPLVSTSPAYRMPENPFTFDLNKDVPDHLHANQDVIDHLAEVALKIVNEVNRTEEQILTDSRIFNIDWYRENNPDIKAAYGENGAAVKNHWLTYGVHEGRQAHPQFHSDFYLNHHSDIVGTYGAKNFQAAMKHYLLYGFNEGRIAVETEDQRLTDPRVFDAKWYLSKYADIRNAYGESNFEGAKSHWLKYGMNEGREGSATFSAKVYLYRYNDLLQFFGPNNFKGALQHYITDGTREGRSGQP